MSPKARQALAIVAVAALVVGVLAGTSVALWQDLSPEERAVLVPILNPRLGLLIMIGKRADRAQDWVHETVPGWEL